ncbi:hypothetical protein N8289_02580 [Flavobacteriales bacterium]|jgi:hypothetical protein|nr:hypothetical protein [Flavobacteriales bacterium]MDB9931635.1 hypothetical protein [Flavobacteriales bacterium]MDC1370705.1 hypothetical protein [Flavobacteriales bacterium]MDG1174907.1 hypothetical protein [Flavobacteriales bacterium]|tara:strand:- start:293 stop:592 length:300 start_codon:yes stop_codon:yes gene_type:complete
MDLTGRLIAPEKIGKTPSEAQWLSGEGGGAWFYIQKEENNYRIKRYTPQGIVDCDRVFELKSTENFNENESFEVQHISHGALVRVKQKEVLFVFEWLGK